MGYPIYVAMQNILADLRSRLSRAWGKGLPAAPQRLGAPRPAREDPRARLDLALALQGGGAHGAFTWGVLDRLLEDGSAEIAALSGASAGAINGAVLASGMQEGGAEAARAKLETLWQRLAQLARFSPLKPTPLERLVLGRHSEWTLSHLAFDLASRLYSPYQLNPFGLRPLRALLVELIDFERLASADAIPLIVAATRVETGAARLFANDELSPDVLLASACLPTLSPAIELDDGHYWDGGFSANPPLLPLVEGAFADDILLVRTGREREPRVPTNARAIQTRVSRLVFDGPLQRELETLAWLRRKSREIAAGGAKARFANIRLHTIGEDEVLARLANTSRLNPEWPLVEALKAAGRDAAERWLAEAVWPGRAANDRDLGAAELAV